MARRSAAPGLLSALKDRAGSSRAARDQADGEYTLCFLNLVETSLTRLGRAIQVCLCLLLGMWPEADSESTPEISDGL